MIFFPIQYYRTYSLNDSCSILFFYVSVVTVDKNIIYPRIIIFHTEHGMGIPIHSMYEVLDMYKYHGYANEMETHKKGYFYALNHVRDVYWYSLTFEHGICVFSYT